MPSPCELVVDGETIGSVVFDRTPAVNERITIVPPAGRNERVWPRHLPARWHVAGVEWAAPVPGGSAHPLLHLTPDPVQPTP